MALVRAACFMTCGYTELGAMQDFLWRINSKCEFDRRLPTKEKYKKGAEPKPSSKENGLTGESLIKEILTRMRKTPERYLDYDVIIIEDDVDCRFFGKSTQEVNDDLQRIRLEVHKALGKEIPVIFLFASPEVEAWFLADWNNTFAEIYRKRLSDRSNKYFCHRLKEMIDKEVLGECKDEIEHYGMTDQGYVKLSEKLIWAIEETKIRIAEEKGSSGKMKEIRDELCENREIRYSKSSHGPEMLRKADPERVSKNCRYYFRPAFQQIRDLE